MLESILKGRCQGGTQEQCQMRGWILQTSYIVRIWPGQDFFSFADSWKAFVEEFWRDISWKREPCIMFPLLQNQGRTGFFFHKAVQQVIWKIICYLPVIGKVSGKGRPHATLFGETKSRTQQKEKSSKVRLIVWQQQTNVLPFQIKQTYWPLQLAVCEKYELQLLAVQCRPVLLIHQVVTLGNGSWSLKTGNMPFCQHGSERTSQERENCTCRWRLLRQSQLGATFLCSSLLETSEVALSYRKDFESAWTLSWMGDE